MLHYTYINIILFILTINSLGIDFPENSLLNDGFSHLKLHIPSVTVRDEFIHIANNYYYYYYYFSPTPIKTTLNLSMHVGILKYTLPTSFISPTCTVHAENSSI